MELGMKRMTDDCKEIDQRSADGGSVVCKCKYLMAGGTADTRYRKNYGKFVYPMGRHQIMLVISSPLLEWTFM